MTKSLKVLSAVMCLVALGGGCAKSNTSSYTENGWSKYEAANGNFYAEFPVYPTYEQDTLPLDDSGATFNYETYSAETSSAFYSVGVFYYPSDLDLSDVDARLQGAVDGMVSSTGGSVVSSDYGYFESYRSINYVLQTPDGLQLKGFATVVDHTVYQLMSVSVAADYNDPDYQHFVSAFRLN